MDENKLGKKITTLREAHHLTAQDLADRCQCDLPVIEGLEAGEVPASLAPLIKITRALGVRLGTLMDDDENLGPAYIDVEQMREVERTKSLETTSGGDLSYFSLAAGRPSRHMDPFVITVDPRGEADHELVGHEGEEWLYGMEGEIEIEYGKEIYVLASWREHLLRLHRAAPGARSQRPEGEVPRRRLHPDLREAT